MKDHLAVALFLLSCASLAVLGMPKDSSAQSLCESGTTCVLTWQQDTPSICTGCAYRTGQNLTETKVTYQNITSDNFGQLCYAVLDGQVYAQPLVATNVTIGGTFYDRVVYVATQNDTLYAIDGDPTDGLSKCRVIRSLAFLSTGPTNGQYPGDCLELGGKQCDSIDPVIGIVSTPIINVSNGTGTIYLVTMTQNTQTGASTWYHYLHAVDISSLTENTGYPILICSGGCGGEYPTASSFSQHHIQRPGLLFASCGTNCGPYVYVSFSELDGSGYPDPNGVIFGYSIPSPTSAPLYFQSSLGGGLDSSWGGGIWSGGAGPAFGPDKNQKNWIYVNTGNGTFGSSGGVTNRGSSFLKLDPSNLSVNDYFTPADQFYRSDPTCNEPNGNDLDYGSGGNVLIPDGEISNYSTLSVSSEKEGGIWFVDRSNPGGHATACDSSCGVCATSNNTNVSTYWISGKPEVHNNPAFWDDDNSIHPNDNFIYLASDQQNAPLMQYTLCTNPSTPPPTTMVCGTPVAATDPTGTNQIPFTFGATPAVSAASSQEKDALVWAIARADSNGLSTSPGILYAFDALSMNQLYASSTCAGDGLPPATKWSIPTVANGFVYVGTQGASTDSRYPNAGRLYIFGSNSGNCTQ